MTVKSEELLGCSKELDFAIYGQMVVIERLCYFGKWLNENIHVKTGTHLASDVDKLQANAVKVIERLKEMKVQLAEAVK